MISRTRVLPFVAVMALVTGFLFADAIPAGAATTNVNCPTDNLQTKITAAGAGDTLVISGTCVGNFIVNNKLTLSGMPGATLDGGSVATTLTTNATKVKVTGLLITGGVDSTMSFGGGGILNFGTLSISHSTVSGNSAPLSGGAGGGIANTGTGILTISSSTLSGNSANSAGGGIINEGTLTISGSTLDGNSAQSGGGIYNDGVLSMSTSTMSTNDASLFGGGIFNILGNATVLTSTFAGNIAGSNGGAIDNRSTFTLSTSTLNKNKAPLGGAISNVGGGVTLTLTSSTVSGNSADDGGGIHNFTGTTNVGSSIVAGNTATTAGNDCTGAPTSNGYNLIGDADGCSFVATTGDQAGSGSGSGEIDPLIGPLANNGGPTQTMRLGLSSPAADAIPAGTALCPTSGTKDQRGTARPAGTTCDIGAYELKPWISRVTVGSGVAATPSVSGTIACQLDAPFTISITLKQSASSGTGSTSGTCTGSTPVAWTASVIGGTFAPGAAQVLYTATASTAKVKGKFQVVLA